MTMLQWLRRLGVWAIVVSGAAIATAALLVMVIVPLTTMPVLPDKQVLTPVEGRIARVTGAAGAPMFRTTFDKLRFGTTRLTVQSPTGERSVDLSWSPVVSESLRRRCGFDESNIASLEGTYVRALTDTSGRPFDLRLGRILCMSYDSLAREAQVSQLLRHYAFSYGPVFIFIGSAMAGLGLWRLGQRAKTAHS